MRTILMILLSLALMALIGCKTIEKSKQKEKTSVKSDVSIKSDSASQFTDTSKIVFQIRENTGTWAFEEWFHRDLKADTIISMGNYGVLVYRKTSFTNSDKTTTSTENKGIELKKAATYSLEAKKDSTSVIDNKQVIATPDYGWILPCIGIGALIGFVAYIFYRRARPVAKIIQMVPTKYEDI